MKLISSLVAVMAAAAVAAPSPALKTRDPKDDSAPRNDDPDFISAVMRAHWYWRRLHCAQDLVWDPELADKAQNDVNKCPQHQTHERAGSNLSAVGPAPKKGDHARWVEFAREATHGWHEEETKYPYGQVGPFDAAWGHFSQMVWRDSSRIGCAMARCDDNVVFPGRFYCYYEAMGNMNGPDTYMKQVWGPVCGDPSRAAAKAREDVKFDWTKRSTD